MMIQKFSRRSKTFILFREYKCETESAPLVFVGQALYILIWTKVH